MLKNTNTGMAQQPSNDIDVRLNTLNDSDALWGPLADFRPAKNQRFSRVRALALAAAMGGIYGMLLNLVLALTCRSVAHLPPVYAIPLVLTFTFFVGFQLMLGPAWNRRAYWLTRRDQYLAACH